MRLSIPENLYLRTLCICIALSILGEFIIFMIFGVILFPDGNLLDKFLWTTVFCGLGMGAVLGVLVDVWVVNRLADISAVIATTALSTGLLGIACNLLCLNLDHTFHYFGGAENTLLFFTNGLVMAAIGGAIAGILIFTPQGKTLLNRISEEV